MTQQERGAHPGQDGQAQRQVRGEHPERVFFLIVRVALGGGLPGHALVPEHAHQGQEVDGDRGDGQQPARPHQPAFFLGPDVEALQPQQHELPPGQQRQVPDRELLHLEFGRGPAEQEVHHEQDNRGGHGQPAEVELLEQEVVQPVVPAHLHGEARRISEEDVQAAEGPAVLLVEVGSPGGRPLTDGQRFGYVDALPAPGVEPDTGGQVFRQMPLIPADLPQGGHPDDVVGPDEQRHPAAAQRPHNRAVEQVRLLGRAARDQIPEIPVNLRRADKGDALVIEIPEGPGEEISPHLEVRVHLRHDVVLPRVLGVPGIMIAGFGPGQETAARLVVLDDSAPAEMPDPQLPAQHPHVGVITLVQQPRVVRVVGHHHAGQRAPEHVE